MRIERAAVGVMFLAGCLGGRTASGEHEPGEPEDERDFEEPGPYAWEDEPQVPVDDPLVDPEPVGEAVDEPDPAPEGMICAGDGTFDFRAAGDGLGAWDGHRVVAAALENDLWTEPTVARRPVLLSGVIAEGAFELFCARSLLSNNGYPSYSLYVDLDDDGRCSDADMGYQMQFYAWTESVDIELSGESVWTPVGSGYLGPAIGTSRDFCGSYFE